MKTTTPHTFTYCLDLGICGEYEIEVYYLVDTGPCCIFNPSVERHLEIDITEIRVLSLNETPIDEKLPWYLADTSFLIDELTGKAKKHYLEFLMDSYITARQPMLA